MFEYIANKLQEGIRKGKMVNKSNGTNFEESSVVK